MKTVAYPYCQSPGGDRLPTSAGLMWVTIGFLSLIVLRPSVHATELLILLCVSLPGRPDTARGSRLQPLVTVPWGRWRCGYFGGNCLHRKMERSDFRGGWLAIGGLCVLWGWFPLAGLCRRDEELERLARFSVSWFHVVGRWWSSPARRPWLPCLHRSVVRLNWPRISGEVGVWPGCGCSVIAVVHDCEHRPLLLFKPLRQQSSGNRLSRQPVWR